MSEKRQMYVCTYVDVWGECVSVWITWVRVMGK